MTDPFALLDLPVSLLLDPSTVEESWRQRVRETSGADEAEASEIHSARALLSDPVARLGAWLEAKDPGAVPERGIATELMDLFARIGPVLASTDALLARHRKATTALARAVLAKESVAAQLAVQGLLQEIQPLKAALTGRFAEFEAAAAGGSYGEARRALGQLKFLKRWEAQCRERLLALLAT